MYTVKKTWTSFGYISETVKDSKFLKTDIDSACPQLLPAKNVEEAALNGWVRGGMTTRDMSSDTKFQNGNRPSNSF